MATKPTTLPRWATDGAALLVEPNEGKKDIGWVVAEPPPAQVVNWQENLTYQWCAYLDDLENQALVWTKQHNWTAPVVVQPGSPDYDNADAITATGNGVGRGITAVGGSSGGVGLYCLGGTNSYGLEVAGHGTGVGAVIAGGVSGRGAHISAGGGNNTGARVWGTGTGVAAEFFGGASGGSGLEATPGGSSTVAVDCKTGGVKFSGTQPTSTADPGQNVLWALLGARAFGHITTNGSGGVTVSDGCNVATVGVTSSYVQITVARAFASVNYCCLAFPSDATARIMSGEYASRTTTSFRIYTWNDAGVTVNPSTVAFRFCFVVFGRQ
jgi:hypothetical protein